jgi:hypothetical protein
MKLASLAVLIGWPMTLNWEHLIEFIVTWVVD